MSAFARLWAPIKSIVIVPLKIFSAGFGLPSANQNYKFKKQRGNTNKKENKHIQELQEPGSVKRRISM
jgi:hypothetical protein